MILSPSSMDLKFNDFRKHHFFSNFNPTVSNGWISVKFVLVAIQGGGSV